VRLTAETRGADTFWMIVPGHPIWGVQGLVVQSLIPLPKRAELTFPVVSPLGRGAVDTYLSLVNTSGRAVVPEASPGLKSVVDETRFRPEEFAGPSLSPSHSPPSVTVTPSLYHVEREGWSLKVRWPREPEPVPDQRQDPGPDPEGARVARADLVCTLRPDGSWVGVASYEVAPRSASFLTIVPPARSEPLWAAIDNLPVPPLRSASGRWLIPLGETTTTLDRAEVRMIWTTTTAAAAGAGRGPVPKGSAEPLALPSLTQRHVPTSVTVNAPARVDVRSTSSLLETTLIERLEVGRVEWQGKQIAAALGRLDPSSPRDGAALVSDLVQFQLLLRDAERSAFWNPTSPLAYRELRISRIEERARIAESALTAALQKCELEEFAESARIHVGLTADDPDSSTLEIPEPNALVRVRRSGQPHFFQGDATEPNRTANLVFAPLVTRGRFQRPLDWVLFVLVTGAVMTTVGLAVRAAERARWIGPATLGVALFVLGVEAGPVALAVGLAMGWLGYAGRVPQESAARP
jgi:hypothetical protein